MGRIYRLVVPGLLGIVVGISGCTPQPTSGKGFTLPDGNSDRGKTVFTELNCHQCHTVSGTELPPIEDGEMNIELGGEVTRIDTYGQLVTSIINPSHRLAKGHSAEDGTSKMKNYNDILTVSQLIDLVAFLQSEYRLKPYEPTPYDMYQYGPF